MMGKICGQAFTEYACGICNKTEHHHNTCVPLICSNCSKHYSLCQTCGADISLKPRRVFKIDEKNS